MELAGRETVDEVFSGDEGEVRVFMGCTGVNLHPKWPSLASWWLCQAPCGEVGSEAPGFRQGTEKQFWSQGTVGHQEIWC